MKDYNDLKDRVTQFDLLQLPGQPQMMHMGTSYLVHDLWEAVKELREELRHTGPRGDLDDWR